MTQLIEQILSLSEEQKIQLIHALSERSTFRAVKAKLPFTIADADKDWFISDRNEVFEQSQFCLLLQ
ncbi:MAG: hypothetical protein LH702_05430 [Phormidesmis sp. CAN_BIN44]|nr:hypothetical protein [Phormidesmis sp. CAN_BIN44]